MLKIMAAACIAGILLRLSYPPSGFPFFVFLFCAPLLLVSRELDRADSFYLGFLTGVCAHADFLIAFLSWGYALTTLPTLAMGFLFGLQMLLVNRLEIIVPPRTRWLVFPSTWPWICILADTVIGIPISLSAVWVFSSWAPFGLLPAIGSAGTDFLILCVPSMLVGVYLKEVKWRSAVAVITTATLLVLSASTMQQFRSDAKQQVSLALVQPALSFEQQLRTHWSLAERNDREALLDDLTAQAIETDSTLIVWPEGGNGLLNRRLLRRQEMFRSLSSETEIALLVSGPDVSPSGQHFNAVHHIKSGEFFEDARKSLPVPFSEEQIEPGEPSVFQTHAGQIGISICYESLFRFHARSLRAQGAELIVVASNDSSFGLSATEYWHAAVSVVRASEVSLPVVFHSNNGVSLVANSQGEVVHLNESGNEPQVLFWNVPVDDKPREFHHIFVQYSDTVALFPLVCLISFSLLSMLPRYAHND